MSREEPAGNKGWREDNGETLLTDPVLDQTALDGLLRKVRDVGMPLHAAPSRETRPGRSVRCQIGNDRPKQNEPEGEVALMLWLLVMSVNVSRWNEQASKASEPKQSVLERAAV